MPESFFNKVTGQVFSYGFCEISKNSFLHGATLVAGSRRVNCFIPLGF